EEVDNLDQNLGSSVARPPHSLGELAQAGDVAVVADSEQWAARDVANAGGLEHDDPGLTAGEALVPVEYLWRDEAIFGRPPRDHRRRPGALANLQRPNLDWREEQRMHRFLSRRPAVNRQQLVSAAVGHPRASQRIKVAPSSSTRRGCRGWVAALAGYGDSRRASPPVRAASSTLLIIASSSAPLAEGKLLLSVSRSRARASSVNALLCPKRRVICLLPPGGAPDEWAATGGVDGSLPARNSSITADFLATKSLRSSRRKPPSRTNLKSRSTNTRRGRTKGPLFS